MVRWTEEESITLGQDPPDGGLGMSSHPEVTVEPQMVSAPSLISRSIQRTCASKVVSLRVSIINRAV
jgi:hypothetical protein